jgi:AraC-like DNA-binding protein
MLLNVGRERRRSLGKIAVEVERAVARRRATGSAGLPVGRTLAQGDGWSVADVVCASGPQDRPFEERHTRTAIAIVTAGSFQYRSESGRELLTPGSLFLGNSGQAFECSHDHGTGDRCLSFLYAPDYFERLAADAGTPGRRPRFRALRVPPLRVLSPVVARACAELLEPIDAAWEEIAVELAARALQVEGGLAADAGPPPAAEARVARAVRAIETRPDEGLSLSTLARQAGLSPYHFLRTFVRVTGVTPHQYVLRVRLREAALRLVLEPTKIVDVAFQCGFGDVSNFNRAFRAEFGLTPRAYRQRRSSRVMPAERLARVN